MNSSIGKVTVCLIIICQQCIPQIETDTLMSDFLFVVSLKQRESSHHLCSGSLLNFKWILTSAQKMRKYVTSPQSLIASRHDQVRPVDRIHCHKNFNDQTLKHDIALVFLKEPFTKSRFVDICHIPLYPMDIEMILKCTEVEVIGFEGMFFNSSGHKVIFNEKCRSNIQYDIKEISFCATNTKQENCLSDTGGPAVCNGFVFGVTSFGCSPGIFTRVDKHLEFFVDHLTSVYSLKIASKAEQRRSMHIVIAVVTSLIVLVCVFIILVFSLGVFEKLKCCKYRNDYL